MLSVIDVGNTNTVLGVFKEDELVAQWRVETHQGQTRDEMGIIVRQLFATSGLPHNEVAGAIISCVVPTMLPTIRGMLERYFGVEPLVVGPGIRTQMPILCDNPKEVGADRIVNAVAAYQRHRAGLIVVDFGTATTFDAISPDGEYLGGAIAPGLGISAEALFRKASKLPRVELTQPPSVVGRNTITSMQSGILYGYVGMVREIVGRMREELSFDVVCVATGGFANVIAEECDMVDEVLEHLTLNGLRILYERNV